MPKVGALLKDVSTEYQLIEPGTYELEVTEVSMDVKKEQHEGNQIERVSHSIKAMIADPDNEHYKKPVYTTVHIHKKDGTLNEVALADLKRFFEAIAPDAAEEDDPDTDVLKGGRFLAQVVIETYTKNGQENQVNRLNTRTISPV